MLKRVAFLTLIMKTLLIALVLVLTLSSVNFVYSVHEEDHFNADAYAFEMCSLTTSEPYYDCDFSWVVIYQYASHSVYDFEGYKWAGFSYHDMKPDSIVSVCRYSPELVAYGDRICGADWMTIGNQFYDSCWDGKCKTLLKHELDHLLCKCNWHDNMKSEDELITKTLQDMFKM